MSAGSVMVIVLQLVLAIGVTPLLIGVMRTTRARLEGRVGGGIWQPWRDLRKLLSKEPTRAPGSTPVGVAALQPSALFHQSCGLA